jgi:hypothetical protein
MTRKAGPQMRKLLALHNDWLRANGYPLHVSREKKQNFTIQGTGAPQPTSEIAKIKSTGAGASYKTLATCNKFQKV